MTLLAFDHGLKKIGVARVDTFVKIVEPLADIDASDLSKIDKLIEEYEPEALIVGLPRGLDGQDTGQTKLARSFAKELESYSLPVILQDEALTSIEAEKRADGVNSVHSIAASIILEDYLKENL